MKIKRLTALICAFCMLAAAALPASAEPEDSESVSLAGVSSGEGADSETVLEKTAPAEEPADEKAPPKEDEPEDPFIDISDGSLVYQSQQFYTGSPIKPSIKVIVGGKTLVKDEDYTISFKNNTNVGTASFVVRGYKGYTGQLEGTFEIIVKSAGAPTGFKIFNASSNGVAMRWDAVDGASGYQMQYYDTAKKAWTGTKEIAAGKTAYAYFGLPSGTTVKMRLRAYKTVDGAKYCGAWTTANASTDPAKVSGLREVKATNKSYRLVWNHSPGATVYWIYKYNKSTGHFEVIAKTKNRYYDAKATSAAKEAYAVRAVKQTSWSDLTYEGQATVLKTVASPDQVTGVSAKTRLNKVTVSWKKVAGAVSYQIFYTDRDGTDPVYIGSVDKSRSSFSTTRIPVGKRACVKVRAVSESIDGKIKATGAFSSRVKVYVFENRSYDDIIDSYYNTNYLKVINGQGYYLPSWLESNLDYQLTCLGGTCSFILLDLDSGIMISKNGNTYMGTASTVKMPYMLYCLNEMEDGYPSMDEVLTYTWADAHGGSSIINTYPFGSTWTIKEVMQTIFDYSDNCGYFMLQRRFGIDGYNEYLSSIGCRTSVSWSDRWGYICACDSAKEWIQMYDYIYHGRYADFIRYGFSHSCASNFRVALGSKYRVFSKCGWTEQYHHDTTVVEAEHPYVLICFTDRVSATRLQNIARAADAVHINMWEQLEDYYY